MKVYAKIYGCLLGFGIAIGAFGVWYGTNYAGSSVSAQLWAGGATCGGMIIGALIGSWWASRE